MTSHVRFSNLILVSSRAVCQPVTTPGIDLHSSAKESRLTVRDSPLGHSPGQSGEPDRGGSEDVNRAITMEHRDVPSIDGEREGEIF